MPQPRRCIADGCGLLRDPAIDPFVLFLAEVNQGLTRGEYFWVDIARDGIALYELPGSELVNPMPLTAADAYEMASEYLAKQLPAVDRWLRLAAVSYAENETDPERAKNAAFNLHQAAETAYTCFLLVRNQYVPRSHNLKFLRSLAEDRETQLIEAWPRATKVDRRRFELAKRAYVEARYSVAYEIGSNDLQAIQAAVTMLRDTVERVSHEWLDGLRQKADL